MEAIFELAAEGCMESEELEEVLLFDLEKKRQPSNLRSKHGKFNLDLFSDEECVKLFRFQKDHIKELALELGLPDEISCKNRYQTTGIEGLSIVLRRFTYPNRWFELEPMFGLSSPYLSTVCKTVMELILEKNGHLLSLTGIPWLNKQKIEQYAKAIEIKGAPISNCWGFIDGTARAMCRPSKNQDEFYSGHKRVHCLKYLSVLCPDGIITKLVGPYPGRRHDSGILRESNFYSELESFSTFENKKYCLYGDAGFPLRELLLCPYPTTNINQQQCLFNKRMSTMRQAVEWGFGKTIKEFAFLDFKKNQKLLLQDLGSMYACATLLSNCHSCLYNNQTSQYFSVNPPNLNEYLSK